MSELGEILAVGLDRRQLIKGAAAGAGALALPGLALSAETPRRGGTLRLAMPYNPAAVDPMTGRNLPDFNVLYAVFDALIDFVPQTLELKPGLAKSWKFTDPKTLVLFEEAGHALREPGEQLDAVVGEWLSARFAGETLTSGRTEHAARPGPEPFAPRED